ncbi:MAG: Trk system potassium transporter TrkA, partial [Bacteroidetes bacterium QH_6_63_17]
ELGAAQVLSVIHNGAYESVFAHSGIDATVNPRREVIEEILRHTRERGVEKLTFVEDERGEVVEIELSAESTLTGRPLERAVGDVPHNFVIGAVIRNGEVITPRGETILRAEDRLVVFADTEVSDEVLAVI